MRTRIDETTLRILARERIVRRLLREEAPATAAAAGEDPGIFDMFASLASEFGMSDDDSQTKETPQGLTPMGVPPGKTAVQAIAELIKASPDRGKKPSGEVVDYIGPQLGRAIKQFIDSKTLVNTPFKVSNPNIVPTEWKNAVEAKSVPEIKLLNPDGSPSSEKIIPKPTAAGLYRYLYAIDTAEYGLLVTRDFLERIDGWYAQTLSKYIDPHVAMINGWTSAGDVRKIGEDVLEIVLADKTPTLMMSKLYLAGFAYENSTVGELLLPAAIGVGTVAAVLGLLYLTGGAGLGFFGGSGSIASSGGAATIGGVSLAVPAAVPLIGGAGVMAGVTTASAAKAAGLILGASVIASYGTPVTLDLAQKAWFGPYSEMRAALAKPSEGEEFLSELAYELEQTPLLDTADEYKRDQIIEAIRMIAKSDAGSNKYNIIQLLKEGSGSSR